MGPINGWLMVKGNKLMVPESGGNPAIEIKHIFSNSILGRAVYDRNSDVRERVIIFW